MPHGKREKERIAQARANPRRRYKVCSVCGILKHITEYPLGGSVVDGRGAACSVCANKRSRIWNAIEIAKNDPVVEDKWCPGCRNWKLAEDYHRNRRSTTGLQTYCKTCMLYFNRNGRFPYRGVRTRIAKSIRPSPANGLELPPVDSQPLDALDQLKLECE